LTIIEENNDVFDGDVELQIGNTI